MPARRWSASEPSPPRPSGAPYSPGGALYSPPQQRAACSMQLACAPITSRVRPPCEAHAAPCTRKRSPSQEQPAHPTAPLPTLPHPTPDPRRPHDSALLQRHRHEEAAGARAQGARDAARRAAACGPRQPRPRRLRVPNYALWLREAAHRRGRVHAAGRRRHWSGAAGMTCSEWGGGCAGGQAVLWRRVTPRHTAPTHPPDHAGQADAVHGPRVWRA